MSSFCFLLFFLLIFSATVFVVVDGTISDLNYHPKGNNPLLYEPGVDPIVNLDADTFRDTVLRPDKEKAYLVEFYKDWCGYCRRFMPWYKVLAEAVKTWPFVQLAAINCADAYNVKTCRANEVPTVPKLKFFSRNATSFSDGKVIEHSYHEAIQMRQQLHQMMMEEFHEEMDKGNGNYYLSELPYERKCKFSNLCKATVPQQKQQQQSAAVGGEYSPAFSYDVDSQQEDPWAGVSTKNATTKYLVNIFERNPEKGLPYSMDLLYYKPNVEVRLMLVWGAQDVQMPTPGDVPYVIVLERGKQQPVMAETITDGTLPKLHEMLEPMVEEMNQTEQAAAHAKKPLQVMSCDANPEQCKQMFYVSETDMLKSIHTALLDEVISSGGDELDPNRMQYLRNFIDFLIQRFPRKTFERSTQQQPVHPKALSVGKPLARSQRAIQVLTRLKQLLDEKMPKGKITMDEWKDEFDKSKSTNGEPFPLKAEWEHCKGSRPLFRGFTCGLWTAFHAMTVQAYLSNEREMLKPLKAIQGWVGSFFSCSGCRKHFLNMTTQQFPMDDSNVKMPEDVVVYLWKAHNIVNARLHGDEATEDPQFPKEQFPPAFLCPDCRDQSGELNQEKVLRFMLQYSTNIKPAQ